MRPRRYLRERTIVSRNTFILGAGASREGGAPLMWDFIDVGRELVRAGGVNDARANFDAVFGAISALQRVHSKSQFDLNNVETVFTAFEMGHVLGSLCDYPPEAISSLASAMRIVIARTIEERLQFTRSNDIRQPPLPYKDFVDLLSLLRARTDPSEDSCVITFNYDRAADFAFRQRFTIDYALSESGGRTYPLLKL